MRLGDYLRLGWDQLRRRIVVTLLCAMGLAIGSSSIIVALAFGESIQAFARHSMNQFLKMDEILVMPDSGSGPSSGGQSAAQTPEDHSGDLTRAKIEVIKKLPHVKAVATYRTLNNISFEMDNKRGSLNEVNITELETLPDFGIEFAQGGTMLDRENTIVLTYGATMGLLDAQATQMLSEQRRSGQEREAEETWRSYRLIPYTMYQKQILLKPRSGSSQGRPNNESADVSVAPLPVRVAAIIKRPEGVSDESVSYQKTAYVSPVLGKLLLEASKRSDGTAAGTSPPGNEPEFEQVKVKVDDTANVKALEELIKKLNLSVQTNLHYEERMKNEFLMIRLIFAGAGLFILFVASISIVVAMTMSTYQRRRQIGIMKVLGANLRQIRHMFMVESALLGVVGGMVGILFSYWVIWGINIAVMKLSKAGSDEVLFISPWILPVGLFFAVLTGVLSGIYPAVNASRTDALTAIKRD
ncbi:MULTISPECIES: ABC transporter permease [Paenibacillus]|uniref:ABC transporter permease n=1 Tax=Paenibacillus TaxID=44249 RepID=UPI0022B85F7F|nr:ABC transporter permease [Paenibacillus caseinilyticus]MCZ8518054.1 ABC transporter permease [Paenibacillus caseinilyticus]